MIRKAFFHQRATFIAQAKTVTLPGSHHLHMEHPQACADEILDFYRGLG